MTKLTSPPVAVETYRDLLAAALDFRALNPWDYMGDGESLAWEDPITGRLRIGVVLGTGGTMFGLAVYRGELGIHFVLKTLLLEDEGEFDEREGVEMDVLRLEFTKKSALQPEDHAPLKSLGFKPEKNSSPPWPCFRSMLPGMGEWFLDQTEAEQLTADLRRMTSFARLLQPHPELFDERPCGEFPFWPRHKPVTEPLATQELAWHLLSIPPRPTPTPLSLPEAELAQLKALPQQPRAVWEAGSAYTLDSIWEAPRPYYTRVGMAVDRQTGFLLNVQVGERTASLEHTAALAVIAGMKKIGFRPQVVCLVDDPMRQAFEPLAQALGIVVKSGEKLPTLIEAMSALMEATGRRGRS